MRERVGDVNRQKSAEAVDELRVTRRSKRVSVAESCVQGVGDDYAVERGAPQLLSAVEHRRSTSATSSLPTTPHLQFHAPVRRSTKQYPHEEANVMLVTASLVVISIIIAAPLVRRLTKPDHCGPPAVWHIEEGLGDQGTYDGPRDLPLEIKGLLIALGVSVALGFLGTTFYSCLYEQGKEEMILNIEN